MEKKYQRVGAEPVQPIMFEGEAFDEAQRRYAEYGDSDFANDLIDYLLTGFVVARPNLFAMAKPVERDGKQGWFIRIAVGNMLHLLSTLPCQLDFIEFCRNNDHNLRVIDSEAFIRKAVRNVSKTMSVNGSG